MKIKYMIFATLCFGFFSTDSFAARVWGWGVSEVFRSPEELLQRIGGDSIRLKYNPDGSSFTYDFKLEDSKCPVQYFQSFAHLTRVSWGQKLYKVYVEADGCSGSLFMPESYDCITIHLTFYYKVLGDKDDSNKHKSVISCRLKSDYWSEIEP